MRIGITGGTGFLGRYIIKHLSDEGHTLRAWCRESSDTSGFEGVTDLEWVTGQLNDDAANEQLADGMDALVHAALWRPGSGFRGHEGDVTEFVETNVIGTLKLIQAAQAAGVKRFIFISTCAVHEKILDDRALDEAHPLWPTSHYGAHKAAIEKFVHSFGLGGGYEICALRPTGIYGLAHPAEESRYFDLVRKIKRGEDVSVAGGGKEVHALDVARAVQTLLNASDIAGQAYNCYDQYISEYDVAHLAKKFARSDSEISGEQKRPKHQIETRKLERLGFKFGGAKLLEDTIQQLVEHA
jgi:nucleoside-diphosphate-sugar epimerase